MSSIVKAMHRTYTPTIVGASIVLKRDGDAQLLNLDISTSAQHVKLSLSRKEAGELCDMLDAVVEDWK